MLQAPFNQVTVSIIGDDAATTFFNIQPDTGVISLAQSILTDTETSYKVRVLHRLMVQPIKQSQNKCDFNSVKLNS